MQNITVILPDQKLLDNSKPAYIAYKGFDKDLKCKNFQFEVGKEYSTDCVTVPKLCSKDGFHYCDNLLKVFNHYSLNATNRFCIIEVTGLHTKDKEKGIATSIKIIREITKDEINEMLMDEAMNLDTVRELQIQNPLLQIGGSIALFLYGVRLDRFKLSGCDFDICMPYYNEIKATDKIDLTQEEEAEIEKFYNNDFTETIYINGTKADIRIDPKQKYEMVAYKGFTYRCAALEVIMEAKFRYALRGNKKHKEDCREIMFPKPLSEPSVFQELNF